MSAPALPFGAAAAPRDDRLGWSSGSSAGIDAQDGDRRPRRCDAEPVPRQEVGPLLDLGRGDADARRAGDG